MKIQLEEADGGLYVGNRDREDTAVVTVSYDDASSDEDGFYHLRVTGSVEWDDGRIGDLNFVLSVTEDALHNAKAVSC